MTYKIAIHYDSDADREYVLNMVNLWAAGAGQGRKALLCPIPCYREAVKERKGTEL